MSYKIPRRVYVNAKKLGVKVKPSTNKNKKIDVFRNGKKVASVGAIGYKDYPTYRKEKGKAFADRKKRNYKSRMRNNRNVRYSNGYYADRLLWS